MLLFIGAVCVAVGLYAKRDLWFPKLEGIGSRFQTIRSSDGTLATGNFPLSISGGIDYQTAALDGQLVILSDAYFYLYAPDGELTESRQHAYANAVMRTSGKRALIYESGGNHFRVESKYKTVYTKEVEDTIVFARISPKGYTAVVTTSENCACVLNVYDDAGRALYTRDCVDRITDLMFQEDSEGCVAAMVQAIDGQICSSVRSFRFSEREDTWVSDPFGTLCIELFDAGDQGVFLLGDTQCAYYDKDGKQTGSYVYSSKLVSGDCADGKAALLFENEAKRQSSLVLLKRGTEEPAEVLFDTVAKSVSVEDGDALVLTKKQIRAYGFGGKPAGDVEVSDSYDAFVLMDKYMFLLGYDKIDRIDYK